MRMMFTQRCGLGLLLFLVACGGSDDSNGGEAPSATDSASGGSTNTGDATSNAGYGGTSHSANAGGKSGSGGSAGKSGNSSTGGSSGTGGSSSVADASSTGGGTGTGGGGSSGAGGTLVVDAGVCPAMPAAGQWKRISPAGSDFTTGSSNLSNGFPPQTDAIALRPDNPATIFVGSNTKGIFRSTICGASFYAREHRAELRQDELRRSVEHVDRSGDARRHVRHRGLWRVWSLQVDQRGHRLGPGSFRRGACRVSVRWVHRLGLHPPD